MLAAFCDFASNTEGKLNLLGVFSAMGSRAVPLTHNVFYLATKIVADDGDPINQFFGCDWTLTGPNEKPIQAWRGQLALAPINHFDGLPAEANLVLQVEGLKFEEFGPYTFSLEVQGKTVFTCVLPFMKVELA